MQTLDGFGKNMPRAATIQLPIGMKPAFPDRCVVCSASHPSSSARVITIDALLSPLFGTAEWFPRQVPCCKECRYRFYFVRIGRAIRTIVIGVVWLFFGLFYLLQQLHLSGVACGLITLGGISISLFTVTIWELLHPLALEVEVSRGNAIYSFRDHDLALAFASLNDAAEQSVK